MANFRVIPEKKFLLSKLKVGILESAVKSRSFKNVRNKNGCVVSSTGKVDLSLVLRMYKHFSILSLLLRRAARCNFLSA